jgi:hypothetical protein
VALQRLQAVCDAGFISVYDFERNPLKVFAAHELAVIDPSMGTKMTVQFNLFGGTVLKLGTERHHHLLKGRIGTGTGTGTGTKNKVLTGICGGSCNPSYFEDGLKVH